MRPAPVLAALLGAAAVASAAFHLAAPYAPGMGASLALTTIILSTLFAPCLMAGALIDPDREVLTLLHGHLGLYLAWYVLHLGTGVGPADVDEASRALGDALLGLPLPVEAAVAAAATARAFRKGVRLPEWRWLAPGVALACGLGWAVGRLA